jgi:hypothetical protein
METKRWIIPAPIERLPALFLAVVVTAMVFAAINAGFTPHAAGLAGWQWQQAGMVSPGVGV